MSAIPIAIPELEEKRVKMLADLISSAEVQLVVSDERRCAIPEETRRLLVRVLKTVLESKSCFLITSMEQLTTQEAAKMVGVSRQFLVRLLDKGKIPYHMVGAHRRVYARDIVEFQRLRNMARRKQPPVGSQYSFAWTADSDTEIS